MLMAKGKHLKGTHSKDKKKVVTISIMAIISILIIILGSITVYGYIMLSNIKYNNINKTAELSKDSGIEEYVPLDNVNKKVKKVTNIALFGLDRQSDEHCRSDTMMVLSIDEINNEIELTSLMRDMYVNIPGMGGDRLNHAYAYGGPGLSINTINQNFALDIQYYASVDFKGLSQLIDCLGGMGIEVKQGEIEYLNGYLDELNEIDPDSTAPYITVPGRQLLNGKQAVGYMRIRYFGNGDFERTERQRTVLSQILERAKKAGVLKVPDLLSAILPYVETNIPKSKILSLGMTCLGFSKDLKQHRLPIDGSFSYQSIRGMSVLVPDMDKNVEDLHKFIYGENGVPATN